LGRVRERLVADSSQELKNKNGRNCQHGLLSALEISSDPQIQRLSFGGFSPATRRPIRQPACQPMRFDQKVQSGE
jgi:hypothetical protein